MLVFNSLIPFCLLIQSGNPTLMVGHPSSNKPLWKNSHRHSHSDVGLLFDCNPIKLTMKNNPHKVLGSGWTHSMGSTERRLRSSVFVTLLQIAGWNGCEGSVKVGETDS